MSDGATNRYEQGLLWVLKHHGAEDALDSLESGAVEAFGAIWEETSGNAQADHLRSPSDGRTLPEPSKRTVSSGPDAFMVATVAGLRRPTSTEPSIPQACRSNSDDGIDAAIDLAIERPRLFLGQFGAWLVGRGLQSSDRRDVARWAASLGAQRRRALSAGYRDRRHLGEDEARRIREVFERLGRHTERVDEAIYRLGLFGVVTATVRRFRQRLHRLASGLPRRDGDRCLHYYRRAWSSSRRGVEAGFRTTLVAFTGWYQTRRGGDDTGR